MGLHETMVPKLLSMHRIAYTNSPFENRELKVAHMHKYFARLGLNKISTFKGQFNSGILKTMILNHESLG